MTSKLMLQAKTQDFIDDMMAFCSQSVEWCSKESENAAQAVSASIAHLLADGKRMSSMSAEAVNLLKDFKVNSAQNGATSTLIKDLKGLCSQERSMENFADPVVEALQFQDRITQMMNNKVRMIAVWALMRSELTSTTELSAQERLDFGNRLLEMTTMKAERDVIRKFIPGLPEEKDVEESQFF